MSLVYIERALERNPSLAITDLNVHRLLLAATIVAAKIQDDDYYSNEYYAKVGGVNTEELMSLEAHMLSLLGWRAYVSEDEYNSSLERLREGKVSLLHPVCKVEADGGVPQSVDEMCEPVVSEQSTPKKAAKNVQALTDHEAATPEKAKAEAPASAQKVAPSMAENCLKCEWSRSQRPRKRSATPGHLSARRNRICLVH
jgi:hypothetical protein